MVELGRSLGLLNKFINYMNIGIDGMVGLVGVIGFYIYKEDKFK